jgi:hypothetical protein
MLSMLANRRNDLPVGDSDLVIHPEVPANIGVASWDRHGELFAAVHRQTESWIRKRQAKGDRALQALLKPG